MAETYALVGSPIEHSPSPAMHNAAFAALGIDATYALRPATQEHADEVLRELRGGRWHGLNVTTPLKTTLAPLVDRLTDDARRAGAVNTLWNDDDGVHGALTDVDGILEPLKAADFSGDVALLLGAGGAARAAMVALQRLGVEVHVAARRPEAAAELIESLPTGRDGDALALDDSVGLGALFPRLDLVIQATPVGRDGQRHALPWKTARSTLVAFEMLYRPRHTPFLVEAAAVGSRTIEGREMLLHQGARSFARWTGQPAPIEVMRAALAGASGR